mgnify:CR=1 FL=1
MTIKILIADKLAPEGATYLRSQNSVEVIENTGLTGDSLVAAISDVDGVLTDGGVYYSEKGEILKKGNYLLCGGNFFSINISCLRVAGLYFFIFSFTLDFSPDEGFLT